MSLEIANGEFLCLLGPSGCGKSTLLRIIAGLEKQSGGEVAVDPAAVASFVFQDAHLLPWRTVIDNAALPLELKKVSKAERRRRAADALQRVGLADDVHNLFPAQLSGGMRMRVSLARALVAEPTLLLLDEPFAALDEITRQQLDDLLRQLWSAGGLTVLFVTHSIHEAAYLGNRVVVFSRRPARVMLDSPLNLPARREAALRTTADFASQARQLFDALERGERA
ncbi:MAG: ATP-binding cassette domain-containing protein [Tepidisphaeraceae bacterium]